MAKKPSQSRAISMDAVRSNQLNEFLNRIALTAKSSNIDHYFRSGQVEGRKATMELGEYFLKIAMGFEHDEFIPCVTSPEFPDFVPQSEDYYPWALFITESKNNDLDEIYHRRAINYLHSDSAGKKNYAVITNFKEIGVYDLKREVQSFSFSLLDLHDAISNGSSEKGPAKALTSWRTFLSNFGPESSREKKKQRRANVVNYIEPKDDRLSFVKRFGHMPDFQKPVGWDGKDFRETFKTKTLPFLNTEEFDWDGATERLENRLIWGDNLSVMRNLPSSSIDLIYIDPPFFSGRNYNCIFGDDDEVRTFNDIWDGGLPTYVAWLNARLWEMKRLLKPNGQIFVHLDYHAVHYMKVELDKIFGYENFRNEIVWHYPSMSATKQDFPRKHDSILRYVKDPSDYQFNADDIRVPYAESTKDRAKYGGAGFDDGSSANYLKAEGKIPDTVWTIPHLKGKERIGYPTQKPEALIERIIRATTNPGDVVADFFVGGGSTIATAEKLGRKWIGVDVSRIAVSVARDRMTGIYSNPYGIEKITKAPKRGFVVQNHGAYEKSIVRSLAEERYVDFILQCYEAVPSENSDHIHGFKAEKAVHVAPAKGKASVELIEDFHIELSKSGVPSGVILAWSWDKEAEKYIDELRSGSHGPEIQLVQVKLVDIDSHEFKEDNIRFLNKPAAVIRFKHNKGLSFVFDGTASQGRNDTDIHYYQWDFDFKKRFNPMTKPNFGKDSDGDGNPLNDNRRVEFEFPAEGKYKVALRIVDRAGAEDTHVIEFDTRETKYKKAA